MSVKDDVRRARIKETAIVWALWFAALPVFVAAALWQRFAAKRREYDVKDLRVTAYGREIDPATYGEAFPGPLSTRYQTGPCDRLDDR